MLFWSQRLLNQMQLWDLRLLHQRQHSHSCDLPLGTVVKSINQNERIWHSNWWSKSAWQLVAKTSLLSFSIIITLCLLRFPNLTIHPKQFGGQQEFLAQIKCWGPGWNISGNALRTCHIPSNWMILRFLVLSNAPGPGNNLQSNVGGWEYFLSNYLWLSWGWWSG